MTGGTAAVDPDRRKYAELVATMRRGEADACEQDPTEARTVRGFIVPDAGPGPLSR